MARIASHSSTLAATVRDRHLVSRRPISYFTWLVWGAIGTVIDGIHESFGVVAYPNPEWIGDRLPVSPAYLCASVGFYILYTLVVGHQPRAGQGFLGGEVVRVRDIAYAVTCWLLAYVLSGALGAPHHANGYWPWIAGGVLAVTALPALWQGRHIRLHRFAFLVAVIGVAFEWSATARGLFVYPVCPSLECLDATVPLAWLPLLYVHAALFIHRLLGGAHALRQPSPAVITLQPQTLVVNSTSSSSSASSSS